MPPPPYPIPLPPDEPDWPLPRFDLRVEDVSHPGFKLFLDNVEPATALRDATKAVYLWLYTDENPPPLVQTLILVLRPMPGVAHTFGSPTTKEVHFSLDYIAQTAPSGRSKAEIMGVLVHEIVHCFQYNGLGKAPGGLVEGVADWVRLRAGLGPPHWREGKGTTWDAGYEATGYFLEWIEKRYGAGSVRELNERLKDAEYDELVFKEVTGRKVARLWEMYQDSLLKERLPNA